MEIRIKLKMFGITFASPENVLYDNNGIVKNTSIPESNITKKHNTINYQCVHEAASVRILCVRKEDTATDLANPFKKFLPYFQKQELLVCLIYNY